MSSKGLNMNINSCKINPDLDALKFFKVYLVISLYFLASNQILNSFNFNIQYFTLIEGINGVLFLIILIIAIILVFNLIFRNLSVLKLLKKN